MSRRFTCAALILAAAASGSSATAQSTLYVRASGNDTNNGTSPATALRTIQAAVGKCLKTTGGYTIYVGPGTYTERVRITNTVSPTPASGTSLAPNRIIGDTSGTMTGDAGGSVIISGGNTQYYGVEINARHYWQLDNLTFSNQTMAGVTLATATGLAVRNCTINLSGSYGIYSEAYNCIIEQNTIALRAPAGHGIYQRCLNAGAFTIERNRIWMTGAQYLSTAYRSSPSLPATYGVYAAIENPLLLVTLSVTNNIITDRHTGIYVDADSLLAATLATVSSNTVVGCTLPVNVSVTGLAVGSLVNNIAASSYYGGSVSMPLGTLSGMLIYDTKIGLSSSVLLQTGVINGQNPLFVSPSSGNFRLSAGSPCIDTGTLVGAPPVDQSGRTRPADGNRDLLAVPDLGAMEYAAPSGLRITAWNQKDQRAVPRNKLPDILALKIGNLLIP